MDATTSSIFTPISTSTDSATSPAAPTATKHGARRRGSVVTWATVILMVVGLLVYLIVAYVGVESGPG